MDKKIVFTLYNLVDLTMSTETENEEVHLPCYFQTLRALDTSVCYFLQLFQELLKKTAIPTFLSC